MAMQVDGTAHYLFNRFVSAGITVFSVESDNR